MKFPLFLISYHTYIMKFIESFACANLLLASDACDNCSPKRSVIENEMCDNRDTSTSSN